MSLTARPHTKFLTVPSDGQESEDDDTAHLDDDDTDDEEGQANSSKKPLPDSLITDLTAHRILALELAFGERPDIALIAATHTFAIDVFYRSSGVKCLEVRLTQVSLSGLASGIDDTPAAIALRNRQDAWAEKMPKEATDLWDYLAAMDTESLSLLFAHCVAYGVNAVRHAYGSQTQRLQTADKLATRLSLNMAGHWKPTTASFFGRITKAHITDIVTEAVGIEAAQRMDGLKKPAMAEYAETLMRDTTWLPLVLRTAPIQDENQKVEPTDEYQAAAE